MFIYVVVKILKTYLNPLLYGVVFIYCFVLTCEFFFFFFGVGFTLD